MRRVRATIVAMERQQVLYYKCVCVCVCVCLFWYPSLNAHAPHSNLWPAMLYNIFPHYLINDKI